MARSTSKPRVSKDQWLAKAIELFSRVGDSGLSIEHLARELGVAKSGFYWHFKNRGELLDNICDYWVHEFTEVVTENTKLLAMPPKERLMALMTIVFEHHLGEFDVAFRAWANRDPKISRKVKEVMKIRLNMLRQIFSELGFTGDEIEMRAQLFVIYESNERSMTIASKKNNTRYRTLRMAMLTEK